MESYIFRCSYTEKDVWCLSPYWYGSEADTKRISEIFLFTIATSLIATYYGVIYYTIQLQKMLHF